MKRKTKTQRPKIKFKFPVCKPCWELKYCPYGPLVEFFPLPSIPTKQANRSYKTWIRAAREGTLKSTKDIYAAIEKLLCLLPSRYHFLDHIDSEELACSVFGHICPVFFSAEPFSETKEDRRIHRTIPRDIMLKVVRRDGQMCQICKQNVLDDEVEFDHIIPHSKGGPTTAENLRLLCRGCNRKKSDSLRELLAEDE